MVLGGIAVALWRLTLGASAEDDGHVVALALRLARGDQPLGDELNFQVLGALPAVPFVYAWDLVVGADGIVLASRVVYLLFTVACGAVAYRALSSRYPQGAALAGVVTALLGIPYQLPVISYSSVPVNALVVASAAGVATLHTRSGRWAVVVGLASAAGAVAAPQLAPAFGLMVLVTVCLVRDSRTAWRVLAGVFAVSVPFVGWLLWGLGLEKLEAAIAFTLAYQSERLSPGARLARAARTYGMLRYPSYWPLLLGLVLVVVGHLRPRWRVLALLGSTLALCCAVLLPVLAVAEVLPTLWFGNTGAGLEVILVLVLAVTVLPALATRGRDGRVRDMAYAAGPAIVAMVILASTTNSGPQYSVHGAGLASLFMVLVAEWVVFATSFRMGPLRWAPALLPSAGMAVLLLALPFQEPPAWRLDTRVDQGPWRGLMTTSERARDLDLLVSSVRTATEGGRGLLVMGYPGAYLAARGPMDTHILWLDDYGEANAAGVRWIERTGRVPDVVLIRESLEQAPGADTWPARDPLRDWVAERYRLESAIPGLGTLYVRR
jgi:hypothetical protein